VLPDASYLNQWQLWWSGNWLGPLAIAPVVFTWSMRWRMPADRRSAGEPAGGRGARARDLVGDGLDLHSAAGQPDLASSNCRSAVLVLLVIASFRLPPRWAVLICAVAIFIAAEAASAGQGPFAADPNAFGRVVALQTFLAILAVLTFNADRRCSRRSSGSSTHWSSAMSATANFVARSTEAVWRIELDEPMPTGLPVAEQMQWLKQNAFVAECQIGSFAASTRGRAWQAANSPPARRRAMVRDLPRASRGRRASRLLRWTLCALRCGRATNASTGSRRSVAWSKTASFVRIWGVRPQCHGLRPIVFTPRAESCVPPGMPKPIGLGKQAS